MFKELSKNIQKYSHGIINSTADLVLFKVYLGVNWGPAGESKKSKIKGGLVSGRNKNVSSTVWSGLDGAFSGLPQLTIPKIERAIRFLLKHKYIELSEPIKSSPTPRFIISEAGGEKLETLFPVYKQKRPWDKSIYIINYDVPLDKNSQRDSIRLFLRSINCGLFQSSVWITPYNPTDTLRQFLADRGYDVPVVVSVLFEEFGGGGRDLSQIMSTVFGIPELNSRYQGFITRLENTAPNILEADSELKMDIAFEYFAILKDDPQLPFELLSSDYLGLSAWRLFEARFFG